MLMLVYLLSRLEFETCLSKTKTKTNRFQDQDPRIWCPRPWPRLQTYKTSTAKSTTGMDYDRQKLQQAEYSFTYLLFGSIPWHSCTL